MPLARVIAYARPLETAVAVERTQLRVTALVDPKLVLMIDRVAFFCSLPLLPCVNTEYVVDGSFDLQSG